VRPVELLALPDGGSHRTGRIEAERGFSVFERPVELARGGVRGRESVERPRVSPARQIRGALGKAHRPTRIAERIVGRCREQPGQVGQRGCPVRPESNSLLVDPQRFAKVAQRLVRIAALQQDVAKVAVRRNVVWIRAQRILVLADCLVQSALRDGRVTQVVVAPLYTRVRRSSIIRRGVADRTHAPLVAIVSVHRTWRPRGPVTHMFKRQKCRD
jgi:hypothetical protein